MTSSVVGRLKTRETVNTRSIAVQIAGHNLAIKTDAEDAYVAELTKLLTDKIGHMQRSNKAVSSHTVTLLAALQLADELLCERRQALELRAHVREKSRRILGLLERDAKP
jgi:cell division protein ZapA (FtsZ GTPase activity inhibitor)